MDRFLLPEPKTELVDELTRLADDIEDSLHKKREASVALARYAELCGNKIEPFFFVSYYGSMTTEQFVRRTLVPEPVQDPTITDDELEDLIGRLVAPEYVEEQEHLYGYWRRIVEVNIPHPGIDAVFAQHPGASPSELLRKAREYKPICL